MATVRAQSEKRGFIGHSTRLPFTELAIDPMRPEGRHADRKDPLNRNAVSFLPDAAPVASDRDNEVSPR